MKGYAKSHKLNINMNDDESIEKAVSVLLRSGNVEEAIKEFMNRLIADGVEYARDIVPVDTGDLRDNISGEVVSQRHGVKGTITAKSDHAAYVEFGVGVVGEGTYPGDTQGYEYNVPSMWKDETGGWWYGKGYGVYTHGNPANPFMFRTANEMRRRAPEIAKEVLNDYQKRSVQ